MNGKLTSKRLVVDDSLEVINNLFVEKKWCDGLPIIPPTEQAVEKMLTGTKRNPMEIVATIPPTWGEATVEKIAINTVMAGCLPEYMPIIITALEAMTEDRFRLAEIQPTTHPVAPLIIVNGPIRKKLNINSRAGAFGPCWRANATIGRAIRLILLNIGGAFPGKFDMSTQGQPSKYTYCVAENEEDSPWEPLHVEKGFEASTSTITVVAAENPHNINEHVAISGDELLTSICNSVMTTGSNNVLFQEGTPVIALCPEHAATIAADGFSKNDVRNYIYEKSKIPLKRFYKRQIEKYYSGWDENALIPITAHKEDLIIIVIGGTGKHSAYLPAFLPPSVTKPITESDNDK
jgi:hypothetical protein